MDWNRDGYLDAIGIKTDGSASFYEFQPAQDAFLEHDLPLETVPSDYRLDVDVADWDGDGHLDLLLCDLYAPQLVLYLNLGNGSFASQQLNVTFEAEGGRPFCHVQAVDWDGDGDLDVMLNTQYFERLHDELVELQGERSPFRQVLQRFGRYTERIVLADWNRDGRLDVFAFDYPSACKGDSCFWGAWHYFQRLLDGSFSQQKALDNPLSEFSGGYAKHFQVVDWNRDGRSDFLLAQKHIYWYTDHLDRWTIRRGAANPFMGLGLQAGEPQLVDLNLDGRMDLLLATPNGLRCFEGQADGRLDETLACFDDVALQGARVHAADWDLDGDLDLILVRDEVVELYERQGDVMSKRRLEVDASLRDWANFTESMQPLAVDWDRDGDLDLILAPGRFFRRDGDRLREEDWILGDVAKLHQPQYKCGAGFCDRLLSWKILDLDFDGRLDLLEIKLLASEDGNLIGFTAVRVLDGGWVDYEFFSPINSDLPNTIPWDETPGIDLADWDGDGGLDVLHITAHGESFFWVGGFCEPKRSCGDHGACEKATSRCTCDAGYDLDDCSGCSSGHFSRWMGLSHDCLPCSGGERACYARGRCYDDAAAALFARQWLSNSSASFERGSGNCSCTEPSFGGVDEAGRVSCGLGECPMGFEEVEAEDEACAGAAPACQEASQLVAVLARSAPQAVSRTAAAVHHVLRAMWRPSLLRWNVSLALLAGMPTAWPQLAGLVKTMRSRSMRVQAVKSALASFWCGRRMPTMKRAGSLPSRS